MRNSFLATDEFRKSFLKNSPSEPKVHYVTPEPYNNNFSQDYVHHALETHEKSKEKSPASSFLEYSTVTRNEPKKASTQKRRKIPFSDTEDYNYYFPESKRINMRSTPKPSTTTVKDLSERFYKPQSPGAIITKDLKTNGNEMVDTYHYYYPEEAAQEEKLNQNSFDFPSSTFAPSTTKAPRNKSPSRKKTPSVQTEHHTSTDSYQYQPVLQRPSQYTPTQNVQEDFYPAYPTYDNKKFAAQSTSSPSTSSPIRMLRPTKKRNNHHMASTTMSPSTTMSTKVRRPSTESPYQDVKQFSVSPSPSTIAHYSTTRAPELYRYSTSSPVSSTTSADFYIKPTTQVTPSVTSSDLIPDGSDDRTVVIKPKTQYQSFESYEPIRERVIYRFVPEETFNTEPNKTESFYSSTSSPPEILNYSDFFSSLNQSSQADLDFYKDFHKNYNYQYFTEQDAGAGIIHGGSPDETMKMDQQRFIESESQDDKLKASKKNMMFTIEPHMNEYNQGSMISPNLEDHEVPPPMNEGDHNAEESKNQYFVLYSVDDEEKKQKKPKRKPKPDPEVVFHHHHHEHDKGEEFQHFDSEFDSEFDSDLTNSDNVRIVDPAVRGGRPLEFTKDDYLRHIKQAVMQYMKDYQPKDSSPSDSNLKLKNHRYQEAIRETPQRPTKSPSAATTASSYKHNLPSNQYKSMAPIKLPKNIYTAGRLSEAIEDMQESPNIDLTIKKNKQKPFDLSAIDVGQSYQHVSHFDHSAALKNVEEFDQSDVVAHHHNKPKLHFSQQTYHDINNLGYSQKQKQQAEESDDSSTQNLFKGYMLQNKHNSKGNQGGLSSFSSMNYDASKLPRIVSQRGHDDDDDDENEIKDPVDAPIQIINGIPVSNPYNIDLNTLK